MQSFFTWFWWDLLLTRLCRRALPELPVPRLPYLYTGWQKSSSSSPSLSGTKWSLWHTTYAHIHLLQHVLFGTVNKAIPTSSQRLKSGGLRALGMQTEVNTEVPDQRCKENENQPLVNLQGSEMPAQVRSVTDRRRLEVSVFVLFTGLLLNYCTRPPWSS